jgi:hypothetical protein
MRFEFLAVILATTSIVSASVRKENEKWTIESALDLLRCNSEGELLERYDEIERFCVEIKGGVGPAASLEPDFIAFAEKICLKHKERMEEIRRNDENNTLILSFPDENGKSRPQVFYRVPSGGRPPLGKGGRD